MKKLLIITISLTAVILMSACSKAMVEKQPVEIPDANQLDINDAAAPTSGITDAASENNAKDIHTSKNATDNEAETATSENRQKQSSGTKATFSEEEAELKVQREGTEEAMKGTLFKSSIGYEIIYAEGFRHSAEGNVDSFATDNSDPALYPYVYVNINKIDDVSVDDYAAKLSKELKHSSVYKSVDTTNDETLGNNYSAIRITAQAGNEWNSVIRNYYIAKVSDAVYQIETQYFVEAEEGYGSIMKAMLNTFNIP